MNLKYGTVVYFYIGSFLKLRGNDDVSFWLKEFPE